MKLWLHWSYVLYQQALDMGVQGTHTRLLGENPLIPLCSNVNRYLKKLWIVDFYYVRMKLQLRIRKFKKHEKIEREKS